MSSSRMLRRVALVRTDISEATRCNVPEDGLLQEYISFWQQAALYTQPINKNEYQKHKNNISGE
jgi:hypothetical protein